jgi:hypothetical protein
MTNIKTRAREIYRLVSEPHVNASAIQQIEAALLSAQNEAYERAAKVVLVKCSSTPVEIAAAIRSLKGE